MHTFWWTHLFCGIGSVVYPPLALRATMFYQLFKRHSWLHNVQKPSIDREYQVYSKIIYRAKRFDCPTKRFLRMVSSNVESMRLASFIFGLPLARGRKVERTSSTYIRKRTNGTFRYITLFVDDKAERSYLGYLNEPGRSKEHNWVSLLGVECPPSTSGGADGWIGGIRWRSWVVTE